MRPSRISRLLLLTLLVAPSYAHAEPIRVELKRAKGADRVVGEAVTPTGTAHFVTTEPWILVPADTEVKNLRSVDPTGVDLGAAQSVAVPVPPEASPPAPEPTPAPPPEPAPAPEPPSPAPSG